MRTIAEEMASYMGQAALTDEEFLQHYGMPRRSGRYPWGSGDDKYQRTPDFLSRVEELKRKGWKETPENIQKEFGLTTSKYRIEKTLCTNERRMLDVARAKSLKADGLNTSEIGKAMGVNESTVRSWFNQESESRMLQARKTADFLKEQVDKKRMIDVGSEVERDLPIEQGLRISRQKLDTALYMLEREGYHVYGGRTPQPTNKNQMTTLKVLAAPDVKHNEIFDFDKIQTVNDYISRDGGDTYEKKFTYPASLDKKRLYIRYPDEGGAEKDGIIELRRGVDDLSLGESRYSQVRILVDNKSYLKGMAVYSDDMPDGVDVVFNTSKKRGKDEYTEVMKKIKDDPENPFGSAIKDADQGGQYWYTDKKTGEKKLGLINKRADEGDWSDWADTLPSQFLAKQSKVMAKKQLDLAKADKEAEFDTIMSLNNPTIKKHYLEKFASECDSAAVSLKAAALPGQKYHVIIPVNSMGDDKIYAPNYKDGTKLALVRYPHGGTFEIPILTVDNKNAAARKLLGSDIKDAVGITSKVAEQLSGADFDGDTVMCIPTHDPKGKVKITSTINTVKEYDPKTNTGLTGFDNKLQYGTEKKIGPDGKEHYYRAGKEVKIMKNTNTQMGIISNLITDMTLAGADKEEILAATRHSMVVIDAEKHKLDYKQSYIDNNIATLQKKYQTRLDENGNVVSGGASTIISRAKGQKAVIKRRGEPKVNIKGKSWYDPNRPEGALIYTQALDKDVYYADSTYNKKTGMKTVITTSGKEITYNMNDKTAREKYEPVMKKNSKTGEVTYTNKDGTIKYRTKARTINSTNMAETDNAETLMSVNKHQIEVIYADYANSMKAMANKARIEVINTGNLQYNSSAKKIYAKEVSSLEAKLNDALKNTVKERTATRLASAEIKRRKEADPDMKPGDLKKISQRSLTKYRQEVGSISRRQRAIQIDDREWEAIQAGAISENKLKQILNNSDPDTLRQRAMPKATNSLNTAQVARIKAMNNSNFTLNQIAEKMNVSPETVSKYLKGVK